MRVLEILEEIGSSNSRLHKEAVLKKNAGNEDLKEVARLALNPFINFYIKKIPEYVSYTDGYTSLGEGMSSLGLLTNRTYTGNNGVDWLKKILGVLHPDDAKVIERIIAKDLRCGISGKTVNKIWNNHIPEYPVQLCEPFSEKLLAKFTWPADVQLKADGMRFNAIVKDGEVEFRSRNGKELDLKGELEKDFIRMSMGKDIVCDGELLVYNENGLLDRKTGNGILNKANKGTISVKEAKMVHAVLWDVISYNDFVCEKSETPYYLRYESLLDRQSLTSERIHVIETHTVHNFEKANFYFEMWLAKGQEGAILKDRHAPWEAKRSQKCLKLKAELECDLICTGWNEGTGKNAGLLGALPCESSDGLIKVAVGTGFSDDLRKTLKLEDVLGKIITLKYNARITNKEGGHSLFLPAFLEIREDKTEADHSKDIK